MKTISTTDLVLIPELAHLRTLDFINPENDELIAPFLKVLGFDLDYPIQYIPCQHRNLQGKVVVGYLIAGEVEINASFLRSPFATTEDRLIAAGYRDLSLAEDLAVAMTIGRDYNGGIPEVLTPEHQNPEEKVICDQIQTLAACLLLARGNPFKSDGSRKTMDEQKLPEKAEKKRKKTIKAV